MLFYWFYVVIRIRVHIVHSKRRKISIQHTEKFSDPKYWFLNTQQEEKLSNPKYWFLNTRPKKILQFKILDRFYRYYQKYKEAVMIKQIEKYKQFAENSGTDVWESTTLKEFLRVEKIQSYV